jgi:hypothetical protein
VEIVRKSKEFTFRNPKNRLGTPGIWGIENFVLRDLHVADRDPVFLQKKHSAILQTFNLP